MGCEECGFYWNHPDEDKPCPLCEAKRLRARVRELEGVQRWRKWPEEKPENGRYEVFFHYLDFGLQLGEEDCIYHGFCNYLDGQWFGQAWQVPELHYRPMGKPPEERKGGGDAP